MANSWSGLRQQLETEYLCPKLRGRVQYFLTHYTDAHDDYGRIAIRVDGVERLRANPFAIITRDMPRWKTSSDAPALSCRGSRRPRGRCTAPGAAS